MRLIGRRLDLAKPAVFVFSLIPFLWLCLDVWQDRLGANPIETLHFRLGDWALRFICLTLLLTPYRQITGQNWVNRFRRMIGLYAFFYGLLHFLVYVFLDISLSWEIFVDDIRDSPYIIFGLVTFFILLSMAATSTKAIQKKLKKNWVRLHRLIYVAAVTAVLHYFMLTKSDLREPMLYALIVVLLLGYRLARYIKSQRNVHKKQRHA